MTNTGVNDKNISQHKIELNGGLRQGSLFCKRVCYED